MSITRRLASGRSAAGSSERLQRVSITLPVRRSGISATGSVIVTTSQWCQTKPDVQPHLEPLAAAAAAVTAAAMAATGSGSGCSHCSSRCPLQEGQRAGSYTFCSTSSCVTTRQPCSAQQRAALNGRSAPFLLSGAQYTRHLPPPPWPMEP